MREKICGIYCIFNKVNHKRYIGQSVDIKSRWSKHKGSLTEKTLSGDNRHLTSAWHKYGEENFELFIVEKCDKSELDAFETFWIDYYDSTNPTKGYNKTRGGKYDYKMTYSEKDKAIAVKICGEKHGHHILSEDDVKQIIKLFENGESSGSIAKKFNVHRCTITHIRNHKSWTYLTEGINLKQSSYCDKHGFIDSHAKAVDMYTLNGIYLKTYSSINQIAEELKVKSSAISNVCYGKNISVYGYVFRFHGEAFDSLKLKRKERSIAIDQYDLNWNYIRSYESIIEAYNITGINGIQSVLSQPKYTRGKYHWLRHNEKPPIAV